MKRIAKTTKHFGGDTQNTIRKLKDEIRYTENENVKLMDQIKEVSEKKLNFYKNGKYNDDVRMVYEDLLSTGLSTRSVERCVRLVLEKLAEANVGRLPKVTFAKDVSRGKRTSPNTCSHKVIGQQRESIDIIF